MNSYGLAFATADRVITSLLEEDGRGLAISIDVGGSLFDCVASNAAELSDCELVRAPSLLRFRSRLRSVGQMLKAQTVIEEPVFFGRIDGFLHIGDENDLLESYSPRPHDLATRSIDSWIVGRRALRLLHLGDPVLIEDQIAGARATLTRDRPILTLYPADRSKERLLSLLDLLGYQAFDLTAKPVLNDEGPLGDLGWIAVPSDRRQDVIAAAGAHSAGAVSQTDRPTLPRHRRSGAIFGLAASGPLPLSKTIDIRDMVAVNDCYPVETQGDHSWRWLGPRPRSRILVPCPLPGRYAIELSVYGSHLENGLGTCRILVEGCEVETTVKGTTAGTISFVGQLDPKHYAGYMEIDIVSTGKTLSAGGDARTLRLSLQSITMSPLQ